jgi:hypothetical protein
MSTLTDEQVDFVLDDLRARGIRLEGLQHNLLDHVCILVEEKLKPGGDFETLYASIIPSFYKQELYELEEEALFLASLRGPHLVLSRAWFFLLAFAVVLSPYVIYIAQWWFFQRPMGDIRDSFDVLAGAMVLDLYPLLTVIVLFLTPNRFDPLIPWRSKVLLGIKPFIRVLPDHEPAAETIHFPTAGAI